MGKSKDFFKNFLTHNNRFRSYLNEDQLKEIKKTEKLEKNVQKI